MHIVTGGAFNGKAEWVKQHYHLPHTSHKWLSAYDITDCPTELPTNDFNIIVLEGVEQWIKSEIEKKQPYEFSREDGNKLISSWLTWEQSHSDHTLVIIGEDISKGIVPLEAIDREWRDKTGWFFQDLVKVSDRFDYVWYGINKQLK